MEVWKPILEFQGLYEVSNIGRVRRVAHYENNRFFGERIKITRPDKDGYETVALYHGRQCVKTRKVHRLVAEAFIENPDNLPQINHKDENKMNNHVNNLEWCDCVYNNNYGTRNQRLSQSVMGHKCKGIKDPITGKFIRKIGEEKTDE